jgi:hypothetical protein
MPLSVAGLSSLFPIVLRSAFFVSVGSSARLAVSLPRDLVTAITPAFDALYGEALGLPSFRLSRL